MPNPALLAAGARIAGAAIRASAGAGGLGGGSASVGVSLRITDASLKQFDKALGRVALETKKTSRDVVIKGAARLVKSLQARSKPGRLAGGKGKQKRPVIKNPQFDEGLPLDPELVGGGAEFFIISHKQNRQRPILIPTNNRNDPRRKIKNAGLMKSSWGWMLRDLNQRSTDTKHKKRVGITTVRKELSGIEPSILLHNRLKYLTLARPGIANESLQAAANSLTGELDKAKKRIARSWLR